MSKEKVEIKELPLNIDGVEKECYVKVKTLLISDLEEAKGVLARLSKEYLELVLPTKRVLECAKQHIDKNDKVALQYIESREKYYKDKNQDEEYTNAIEKLNNQVKNIEYVLETYFTEEVIDGVACVNPKTLAYVEIYKYLID